MESRNEKQGIIKQLDTSAETYCPICGKDAADPSLKRFGEIFCSEAHIEEFAREDRSKQAAQPIAAVAATATDSSTSLATGTPEGGQAPQKKGRLSGTLKMGACCAGILLLLPALGLVSAGGLAAVAGAALSVLAVLACPIGMYFMMRGMKREQGGSPAEQKKQLSDDTVNQGVKR